LRHQEYSKGFRETKSSPKGRVVIGFALGLSVPTRRRFLLWFVFASFVTIPLTLESFVFSGEHARATAVSEDSGSVLRTIISTGRLDDLRWPDFSDYRSLLQSFYELVSYHLAWVRDGQPTAQGLAIIEVLQAADLNGLNPEDYDSSRWKERLARIEDPGNAARFDAALTVCVMRYISDVHIGRLNPQHFKFGLAVQSRKYDLPRFVRERLVDGQDPRAAIADAEPTLAGYKRTVVALRQYLKLSALDDGEKLLVPLKTVAPGSQYAGVARLTRFLGLLGDMPADAAAPSGDLYEGALVEAVKHFQRRHGLTPDGRLGEQTLKQLNTPLSARIEQLRLTLERWRWLPQEFPQPPIVVNIPEFRLRTFDDAGKIALSMNVIVGKAMRHETPVFERDMRFVVFRPYWNVPPSIQRSEIVPAIQRDRNYISTHNYEVVTQAGKVVTSGGVSDEVLQDLRAGKLGVRQKPGPKNALGLVKLMFPNEYFVYLHSTPAQQLFGQSRRDFSHGCIRVEKPDELTAWALRNNPGWNLERVQAAMQGDKDDVQVNLLRPIPVLILYGTAVVDEAGVVHFYDDLYGHDASLEAALAKGYPYPG
jgi:L,D-transpeptidase YcbB